MSSSESERSHPELSLFASFEAVANQNSERTALMGEGGRGNIYTYGAVLGLALKLSQCIRGDETEPRGSEIGLLSENRPMWPIAYLAILAAGCTVVPLDANLKPNELRRLIDMAELDTIICSGRFEPIVGEHSRRLRILSFEPGSESYWRRDEKRPSAPDVREGNDVASLIFTSGTTGDPKAVELTHRNILSNIEGVRSAVPVRSSDVFLSILPLHHTFETTIGFLLVLLSGGCVVYARSLKSGEILQDIRCNGVTAMLGVPLLYEKMYGSMQRKIKAAPTHRRILFSLLYTISSVGWKLGRKWGRGLFASLRKGAGLGSVRLFVSGAAPIPPAIGQFFNLLGFDFVQGYGMTECSPVISANRPGDISFGSVGPPLENLEVKIHQPDHLGLGEICVRGESVTPGYRNNPTQTAELIRDGWLHTGDLGQLRKGHLWITGRAKSVIVSAAGKNIYPEELEEKLGFCDCILEAVVFGRKKENRQGEDVCAVVVPDVETICAMDSSKCEPSDQDRIRTLVESEVAAVNNAIADYKRISNLTVQFEELQKTSTKKVKRFLYK
jgi:long-chain acyl-CoA synthetase